MNMNTDSMTRGRTQVPFYMSLTRDEFDRLSELARLERRSPRQQAEYLLAGALAKALEAAQRNGHLAATGAKADAPPAHGQAPETTTIEPLRQT